MQPEPQPLREDRLLVSRWATSFPAEMHQHPFHPLGIKHRRQTLTLGLQASAWQVVALLPNWAAQQVQRRQSGSRKEPLMSGGSAGGRRGGRRSGAGLRRFPTSAPCEPSKGGRREHEKGLLAGISCLLCDPAALPAMGGPGPRHTR